MDFTEEAFPDMGDQLPQKDPFNQASRQVKTKTTRRGGACEACKKSKTKCDGQMPCGACRSEKRKSRTCEYSHKALGIAASRGDNDSRKRRWTEDSSSTDESEHRDDRPSQTQSAATEAPAAKMFSSWTASSFINKRISLCQVVEEFAGVKSSKSRSLQNITRVRNQWRELQNLLAGNNINDQLSGPAVGDSTTQTSAHESAHSSSMVEVWQSRLDIILQQINKGDLMGAWNKTSSLLRAIETWEMYASNTSGIPSSSFPPSDEFINQISSICLQLVELDCTIGFFLGGQSLLPAWDKSQFLKPKFEQCKLQDHNIASRVDLYTNIQQLLEVNVSDEEGIFNFLNLCHDIKSSDPATELERMATCTTDNSPAEKQVLKLTSNLVFAVMYCRTASVCGYYSHEDRGVPVITGGPSDIVLTMKLHFPRQKGNECSQVVKHAGNALQAFEKLCEIDPEDTAKSWFRVHGALIAAVLIAIAGLREKQKRGDWENTKARLTKLEARLSALKELNPTCPIFDKGIQLLAECDQRKIITPASVKSKFKTPMRRRSQSCSSSGTSVLDEDFITSVTPSQPQGADRIAKRMIAGQPPSRKLTKKRKLKHDQHHAFETDGNITYAEREPAIYARKKAFLEEAGMDIVPSGEMDTRVSFPSSGTSSYVEPVPSSSSPWSHDLQHQGVHDPNIAMHPPLLPTEDWLQKWQPEYGYIEQPTAPMDIHYHSNPPAMPVHDQQNEEFPPMHQGMHQPPLSPLPGLSQTVPHASLSSPALAPHPGYEMAEATQFFNSTPRHFQPIQEMPPATTTIALPVSVAKVEGQQQPFSTMTPITPNNQHTEVPQRQEVYSTETRQYHTGVERPSLSRRDSESSHHHVQAEQYQYQPQNYQPYNYQYAQAHQQQQALHPHGTYGFQNHHCAQAVRDHQEQLQYHYSPYHNVTKSY